ncbi:N-acetylmuramoyl-L-alanine amidase, partial [Candidatus Cyanaurora vandensis]|uniref:N-acetylmuramoyl-L-alanine amidase family protein n=1 Tax=Candidatus Cyanaurora vandensis TaxID=2714958 RepID=UPI00257CE4FC
PDPSPLNAGKPLIFVDAGHGGSDPGALGVGGVQEKDINLKLALRLGRELVDLGYRVGYTRQDDRFIPLQGRVDLAERARADLFVSLHQNASDNPWAQGIETYYTRFGSARLASLIHRAAVGVSGRPDRGVRQARFHVIRQTTMPAILLEGGYVSNAFEVQQLVDDNRQQKLATGLARAIDRYLRGKR